MKLRYIILIAGLLALTADQLTRTGEEAWAKCRENYSAATCTNTLKTTGEE